MISVSSFIFSFRVERDPFGPRSTFLTSNAAALTCGLSSKQQELQKISNRGSQRSASEARQV